MNKGLRGSLRAIRLTPERTPEQRAAAWARLRESMDALAAEAKRNGLTGRKLQQILREIERERKAKRRGR
jgi:hypothetical protein